MKLCGDLQIVKLFKTGFEKPGLISAKLGQQVGDQFLTYVQYVPANISWEKMEERLEAFGLTEIVSLEPIITANKTDLEILKESHSERYNKYMKKLISDQRIETPEGIRYRTVILERLLP
jgi:hypothetical protein